jgi:hypothetical protein
LSAVLSPSPARKKQLNQNSTQLPVIRTLRVSYYNAH